VTKLLEGIVDTSQEVLHQDLRDALEEVDRLKGELRKGFEILNQRDLELDKLKRIIRNLQGQLNPLHRALKAIFGEIELAGLDDIPAASVAPVASGAASTSKSAAWELWKRKLPGIYPAKFIDALLEHGALNSTQLSIITGCHKSNIAKEIYKLNQAGIINKNGGIYSLKQI
jgi:hypothetical protein